MSLKPEIVSQALVVDQVKGLHEQKYRIEVQIEQLQHRLKLLQDSLAENGALEDRVKSLLAESLALYEEEWVRKAKYYPDIWLATLEQSLLAALPAKKKTTG